MTPEQKAGLKRLMLRWPERRDQLAQAPDSTLAECYESYELAALACAHWSAQMPPQADAIAAYYRSLCAELEREIANALDCRSPLVWPF